MVTCILALLVLAVIVGMSTGEINHRFWMKLGVSSIAFIAVVVIIFPVFGRWFLNVMRILSVNIFLCLL